MHETLNYIYLIKHKIRVIKQGIKLSTPIYLLLFYDLGRYYGKLFKESSNHFYDPKNYSNNYKLEWTIYKTTCKGFPEYWINRYNNGKRSKIPTRYLKLILAEDRGDKMRRFEDSDQIINMSVSDIEKKFDRSGVPDYYYSNIDLLYE